MGLENTYCRMGNFVSEQFCYFTGNDLLFELYFRFSAVQHVAALCMAAYLIS